MNTNKPQFIEVLEKACHNVLYYIHSILSLCQSSPEVRISGKACYIEGRSGKVHLLHTTPERAEDFAAVGNSTTIIVIYDVHDNTHTHIYNNKSLAK